MNPSGWKTTRTDTFVKITEVHSGDGSETDYYFAFRSHIMASVNGTFVYLYPKDQKAVPKRFICHDTKAAIVLCMELNSYF
jgi:hypothetical protein